MAKQKTPQELQEENTSLQEQLTQANEKLEQAFTEKENTAKTLVETQEQLTQANEKLESLQVGATAFQTLIDSQKEKINELETTIAATETSGTSNLKSSSITTSILTKATNNANVNIGLTKVKISYPEEYKEEKHFKDGDEKYVSKEAAEHFVKLGIASIVE